MPSDSTPPSAPERKAPSEGRRSARQGAPRTRWRGGRWRALVARIGTKRLPRALVPLLVLAAIQSLAWDVALPAFQGPDEDTHFAYVQYLAETGHLPSPTSGGTAYSTEVEDTLVSLNLLPLIGDTPARPAWGKADLKQWRALDRAFTRPDRENGAGPNPIAKNPPLYYALMAIPYRLLVWLPLLKRIFFLRLINALCYLITIGLTWLIASELFPLTRWKQVLATGAVALEPQLAFMSAVINADNLLIALTTGVLLTCLRLVTRGPSMGRVLAASGLTAAAVVTHGRGLVTVPVLIVALAASCVRFRPVWRNALARVAAAAGTVGAALLAYVALRRGSGGGLYGGQITMLNSGTRFSARQFVMSIYDFYFSRPLSTRPRLGPEFGYKQVFIDTFYGSFGSLEVRFAERIYDALQVLSALGLVGLYTAVVVRRRLLARAWPVVLVLLSLLVTNVLFLHYVSYRALLGDGGSDPLIVGRYLLPMVPLFGLAIAFTVGALPARAAPLVAALVLALGVLVGLGGIGMTMARFYG